jgi:hypothetical protein
MAVGSGLSGQFGAKAEGTWGTYTAPDHWYEVIPPVALGKRQNTVVLGGIAAGRVTPLFTRRVITTKDAGGTFTMQVPNTKFGLLVNSIFGGTPTVAQQGGTIAYLQTHTINSDIAGKSLTIQVGVPQADGTVKCFSFLGSKVKSLECSVEIGGATMATFDVDCKDLDESQTLTAASYPITVAPFHWGQSGVKIHNTYGSEAAVSGVRKVSVKFERPMADGLYYQGNLGLKNQQITNDNLNITGVITADFLDKTVFNDRFTAGTGFAFLWECVGPIIASTFAETFRIKLPKCALDGDTPTIDSMDVVSGDFPFTALYDGTNGPAIIEYMSIDTAI